MNLFSSFSLRNLLPSASRHSATDALWMRYGCATIMLLFTLALGQVWAAEQVAYTLTPASGSNNSYTDNCDITIDGITWNLTGNSQQIPWRIGGKSITGVDREVYSKTAMSDAITKVELNVGAASSITVNLLKLIVASDASFNTKIDEVTKTFAANSTITFQPTSPLTQWATGAYYKFVFNVTVSGSNNKFVEFSSVKFYKEVATETCETPTFSPAAGTYYGSQEITLATITTDASIYYTLDGTTPSSSNGTLYEEPFTITETKTVKAIAVKDGATDSGVAEATYTAGATVSSYVIDFETSNLAAYVNWVFDKLAIRTSTITAHGGTYYGSNANSSTATSGTTSATITTAEKIATPGVLTFYISKETTNTTACTWKAQVSEDGDTWTDVQSFVAQSMTKGEWVECTADLSAHTDVYVRISYGSSGALRAIDDISLSTTPSLLKPTITGVENFVNTTEVTISHATADAIYYTTNGDAPTASSTLYSAPFELNATTTVKAIAVKGGESSPVAEKEFTKIVSWSVAEANEQLGISTPLNGKYVRGIISQIDSYGSNAITYWISDDGTTTNQLEVYKGKGLNNANFSAITDLALGDVVVVYGNLKVFTPSGGSSINEFDAGNYLVSKEAPAVAAPVFSPDGGGFMGETDVTITCETAGSAIYYTLDGETPSKSSTPYTAAIHLDATTTIKAIAYVGDDASLVVTKTFTLTAPMTVAEALTALDTESPINNVAVAGIISTAPSSNPSSGRLTYYISDDGSATSQLEVYLGYGLSGASFANKTDLQVGDEVTVFGNLKIYSETKEFDAGNRLLAFNRPVVAVTGVELNKESTSLEVGETESLVATVAPENASNKSVTWSVVSGDTYASVADGVVTGLAAGEAVIRATSAADNTKYAECTVTVTAPAPLSPWASVYTSNITLSTEGGTSASVAKVKLNGESTEYDALKAGTSGTAGAVVINVPAQASKLHLHAYGWKGESVTLSITAPEGVTVTPSSIEINANTGVTNNSPFTLAEGSTPQTDAYYALTLSGNTNAADITITATSGKRFVLFGVNQEGGAVPVLDHIAITGTMTNTTGWKTGDEIAPAGLTVNAVYTLNDVEQTPVDVTSSVVWSHAALTEGQTEVTLTATYTEDDVVKTATKNVTISAVETGDPTIITDPASYLNFGSSVVKDAVVAAKTITITLKNITSATATLGGTNYSAFSIDKTTGIEDGNVITVSVNTGNIGTYAGTVTIKDDNSDTEKVITLSMTVVAPEVAEEAVSTTSKWVAATEIVDGMEVLLTGVKSNTTYALSAQGNNNRTTAVGSLSEDIFTPGENTMSVTLVLQSEGKYALRTSNGKYLYASSSSANQLKTRDAIGDDGKAVWSISINGNNEASIVANCETANWRNTMQFNQNGNNAPVFACYASATQSPIKLYVPQPAPAPTTYTVTFEPGSYEFGYESVISDADGKVVLPAEKPVLSGYYFRGWSPNNSYDILYRAGAEMTITGDITLYAQWEQLDTYSREIAANKVGFFGTICLEHPVYAEDCIENAEVYKVVSKNADNSGILLEQVTSMEAGMPYFFVSKATTVYFHHSMFNAVNGPLNYHGLHGTIDGLFDDDAVSGPGNYVLQNNLLCETTSGAVQVGTNRAYLVLSEVPEFGSETSTPSGVRRRVIATQQASNTATGWSELQSDENSTKLLINGTLYIIRDGRTYNAQGQLIR